MHTAARRTSTVGSHGAPCTDSQEQQCEGYGASQGASGAVDARVMLASWANANVLTSTGHGIARAHRIHGLQCSCSERKTAATRCGAATARANELTVPSCGMPSMMPSSTPCSPRAPLGTRPALLKARGGRSDSRMDAFACLRFVRIHAFRPGVRTEWLARDGSEGSRGSPLRSLGARFGSNAALATPVPTSATATTFPHSQPEFDTRTWAGWVGEACRQPSFGVRKKRDLQLTLLSSHCLYCRM